MSEPGRGTLPPGWAVPSLREVASINPPLDRCVVHGNVEVTFVPMRAVEPNGGGVVAAETRRYRDVKKGYTSFLSGDVIMAKITPCMENGKTAVVPDVTETVCFGSTEFHVVRPAPGVLARWVAQFLLQHETRRAAQRAMSGAVGQMRVPASFLDTVRIPLPPTAEQERIADALDELLSDLDAGVALLEKARAKLNTYRASVLKSAVDGSLTAEWRDEHPFVEPAADLLDRILVERRTCWETEQLAAFAAKSQRPPSAWRSRYRQPAVRDTAGPTNSPQEWSWARFDQIAWRVRSGSAESSGRTRTEYPVLKSSAVRPGMVDFSDLNFLDAEQSRSRENFLKPNDFLITRLSGSVEYVGCTALVGANAPDGIQYPDRIFCAKLVPGINGGFLAYCFEHPRIRKVIEAAAKSTAGHQRISISDLVDLVVPLPPLPEQDAIVEIVEDQLSVIDHLEADLDAKLTAAQSLRQSILRHAFTGQLVPQDPNDEPAAVLLARIATEREAREAEPRPAKTRRPRGRGTRSASAGV